MLYFCALSNVYVAYAMCILQKSQNLFRSKTAKSQNLHFFNTFPNKTQDSDFLNYELLITYHVYKWFTCQPLGCMYNQLRMPKINTFAKKTINHLNFLCYAKNFISSCFVYVICNECSILDWWVFRIGVCKT